MSAPRNALSTESVERHLAQLEELCALSAALLSAQMPPLSRETFERRALGIEGRASEMAARRLPRSFGHGAADPRDVLLWASFAGARHELGWMPDVLVEAPSGRVLGRTQMLLVAVTQEFDRRVDAVERGHKTLVMLRVLGERAACLDDLPILEQWEHRTRIWVGSARDYDRTAF